MKQIKVNGNSICAGDIASSGLECLSTRTVLKLTRRRIKERVDSGLSKTIVKREVQKSSIRPKNRGPKSASIAVSKQKSMKVIHNENGLPTSDKARGVMDAGAGSGKMLGAHVSVAGGLHNAFDNALSIGCRSFAFFVRNQRSWNSAPLKEEMVEKFKRKAKETDFPMNQIVVHGSYLINCGSYDSEILTRSRAGMLDECKRCEQLGILFYNIHPGSTAGKCTREECMKTIAASLDYVIDRTEYITILIETMAGQGNTVGGSFDEIRQIICLVKNKERIGVCLDTCHIFAAGYDLRSEEAYKETFVKFENIIGLQYLRAFHINDSLGDLGSKLDRHANIGKGKLKLSSFRHLMTDARFNGLPMILETPEGDYADEMIQLYRSENNH